MPRTLAIFGAGVGLGTSLARRFGREGYQIALVGRRPEPLRALAEDLADHGISATAFPADLSAPDLAAGLVSSIENRMGPIDAVEYSPISTEPFTPAAELDSAALAHWSRLYLLTPVEIIRAVLPGMIGRGDGGILVTHGSSATNPTPGISGIGPAMAGMRNYLHSLHGEVADKGVYVGSIVVGALVLGSEGHRALSDSGFVDAEFPTVAPDTLAESYWRMLEERGVFERFEPAL